MSQPLATNPQHPSNAATTNSTTQATTSSEPAHLDDNDFHSQHHSARKRRRKTFACIICRRRKLKCDQAYPSCSRCLKSGTACIYGRIDENDSTQVGAYGAGGYVSRSNESAGSVARASFLGRPSELESTRDGVGFPMYPQLASSASVRAQVQPTIIFRGRDFKTQFYGRTNPIAPVVHFPELRSFMTEGLSGGVGLARMQNDMRALKRRKGKSIERLGKCEVQDLLALLPEREEAKRFAVVYFEGFESSYRVLHAPSFWREWQELVESPGGARAPFLVVLLLVVAIGRVIDPKETVFRYVGPSSLAREQAIDVIVSANAWLEQQSRKHTTLEYFQVPILLHVLKQVTVVKKKRSWEDARAFMTNALAAGFHREPSLLSGRISVFEQEIRRRLWATMVELELQASMERGMRSSTSGLTWDCAPPLNLNDEDLTEEMESLPEPHREDEYTGASFLVIAQKSVSLRISINAVLNDTFCPLSQDQIFEYERQIEDLLQHIPWESHSKERSITKDQETLRSILTIQLRQFLVLIHGYFITNPGTRQQEGYSTISNLNTALDVIDTYYRLSRAGNILHQLLNCDVLRVGLSICQTVCTSNAFTATPLLRNLVPLAINSVEQALSLIQDTVMRLGQGFKEYWYLSAAFSVLQLRDPDRTNVDQKQAAVDRIAANYYRVLGSQEDMFTNGATTLPSVESTVTTGFTPKPSTTPLSQPFALPSLSQETTPLNILDALPGTDSGLFPIMDMSNWTLEEFWSFDFP
jgi:Fungal Zn(2)-Cys(6) binuclear cluster domain/Fungal specific transcription factor domain